MATSSRSTAAAIAIGLGLAVAASAQPAWAGLFTVGPGGSHSSIQAAVDAAIGLAGQHEIRVAAGTWSESVTISPPSGTLSIALSGGWLPGFAARSSDPGLTRVDAGGAAHALRVNLESGGVALEGLTLSQAAHGLYVDAGASASVTVTSCRLVENSNSGQSFTYGSGLWAELDGAASLEVEDLVAASNTITSTGSNTAVGAGISIFGSGQSAAVLRRVLIEGNTGQTEGNQVTGVGIYMTLSDGARAELEDVVVRRNEAVLPPGSGAVGVGGALWINDSSQLSVTRSLWFANSLNPDRWSEQLSLITSQESSLRFADSVVAHSGAPNVAGVTVDQRGASTLRVTGCTFADNSSAGLFGTREGGELSISNVIAFGNSPDLQLPDGVAPLASLAGVDPMFVDPGRADYRLLDGSPAIDAGSSSVPGGLSQTDLGGLPRIAGARVDAGAHEHRRSARIIPVVTHAQGFGGTPWRSDVAYGNLSAVPGEVTLTLSRGGERQSVSTMAAAGASDELRDIMVSVFGAPAGASRAGSLEVAASNPAIAWTSRTFADPGGAGTYGQSLDALEPEDLLTTGDLGLLPLVRSDDRFYTNLGAVNGTAAACQARVRLRGRDGHEIGTARTITIPAWEWLQLNDLFAELGAGPARVASATVEVLTPGARAWFYASIVDRVTRDPTTVPVVVPGADRSSPRLAAVVHLSGMGGTPWRTAVGIAAPEGGAVQATVVFRSESGEIFRAVSIGSGGAAAWDDVLVELFGLSPDSSAAGTIEVVASRPVAVLGRSYADLGTAGTYGQALPSVSGSRSGFSSVTAAVLPQIRRDAVAYTNLGLFNLGAVASTIRVTLFDGAGIQAGSPVERTLAVGQWLQVNDIFSVAGAGNVGPASALVEVLTPGGRAWSYASVIDRASRDPTTVAAVLPWVTSTLR